MAVKKIATAYEYVEISEEERLLRNKIKREYRQKLKDQDPVAYKEKKKLQNKLYYQRKKQKEAELSAKENQETKNDEEKMDM